MNKRQPTQSRPRSNQSGFTIIESLIAIIVVAILMSAIAPVIVLSVATRVQARRVERGTQAARTYIDGVRAGTIPPPKNIVEINEVTTSGGTSTYTPQRETFVNTPAPANTLSCTTTGNGYCDDATTRSLYCVDLDGGGCSGSSNQDIIVQAFRSIDPTTNASIVVTDEEKAAKGYILGVRVYRADGFDGNGTLKTMKANQAKQSTFTGGLGDTKAPLMELSAEIVGNKTTYRDYCDRFGGCSGAAPPVAPPAAPPAAPVP